MRVENHNYQHRKKGLGRPGRTGATHYCSRLPKEKEYNKIRPAGNESYGGSVSFKGMPKPQVIADGAIGVIKTLGRGIKKIPQAPGNFDNFVNGVSVSTFGFSARKLHLLSQNMSSYKKAVGNALSEHKNHGFFKQLHKNMKNSKHSNQDAKIALQEAYRAAKELLPAKKWAVKLAKSDTFEKVLKFVNEKSGVFDAFNALILAGMLKPVLVLAMPGAEDEDKEQIATKNFVAAMLGFILSATVLSTLSKSSKAVLKMVDENKEAFTKNPNIANKLKTDEKYREAYSSLWQKGLEVLIAPTKAAITVALMPIVTKKLFGKKNEEKKQAKMLEEYKYILPTGLCLNSNDAHLFRKSEDVKSTGKDDDGHPEEIDREDDG